MNKILLASLIVTGLSSSVVLAATGPSSSTLSSAMDVLNLPAENRRMILADVGEKHYAQFISLAFNEKQSMAIRWRALTAAAESRGTRATTDLMKAGEDKVWYMRNAALVALQEVNPAQGEILAQKLLKDKALVVRSAAVQALEKSQKPEVRDILWDELNQAYNFKNKESLWIRHQIVTILGQKPLDREMKSFADLLKDKDQRVQVSAIRGLQKLTGVKLAEESSPKAISMWQDYLSKYAL